MQAGPSLLRGQGRGEVGQSWSEEGRRGAGGEEVGEQVRGGSANWPTPLDITLPLELSSKPVKSPETVSEVGGSEGGEEGELFRGSYQVEPFN